MLRRNNVMPFIGSMFGKGSGGGGGGPSSTSSGGPSFFSGFGRGGGGSGGSSGGNGFFSSASQQSSSGPASGGGGFMPNFMKSMQNGGGLGGAFTNGDFGSMYNKALEWCSISHAQEIARRRGIDVREIKFETLPGGQIRVMVDAPTATPLQVQQLGAEVMEECPLARFRKNQVKDESKQMQWLRLPDRYDR